MRRTANGRALGSDIRHREHAIDGSAEEYWKKWCLERGITLSFPKELPSAADCVETKYALTWQGYSNYSHLSNL